MKKLLIEWKHYDKEGNTCIRCSKTGVSLEKAIREVKAELAKKGVGITYKETKLSEKDIQKSNSILLNGILLEDLLDKTKSVETSCNSCCDLIGSSVNCKALDCDGQINEDISAELIKEGIKNVLRKKKK